MSICYNGKTSSHICTDLHKPHKKINDFPNSASKHKIFTYILLRPYVTNFLLVYVLLSKTREQRQIRFCLKHQEYAKRIKSKEDNAQCKD